MNIDAKIALVEQIINYIFTNKVLCAESLQMAAPEKEMQVNGNVHLVQKNLNLAVLGDTLLSTLLCEMWYESRKAQGTWHPFSRKEWTTVRIAMTTNESLGERGFALRLNECIVCNAGTVSSSNMVADTIEAILAAVYMDAGVNGIASARAVVEHLGLNDHILLMFPYIGASPDLDAPDSGAVDKTRTRDPSDVVGAHSHIHPPSGRAIVEADCTPRLRC